jgi:hypothetical protein
MKPASKKRTSARIWFYVGCALLALSVWSFQKHVNNEAFNKTGIIFSGSSGQSSDPTGWDKMSVQAMSDVNGLLTTLATAMLGALGFLMSNRAQEGSTSRHIWAALLGAVGGGLSLYCGYVAHVNLLTMISTQNIDPHNFLYRAATNA